jgi:type IV pilus assembly protein PilM
MFTFKKKEIVGVDIGTSSIKVVQLREHKGVYHLLNVGILPLPPEAIVDNTLMDSSTIVETVKNLIRNLGIKTKDVACSISGNSVIIRKINLSAMQPEELDEQIHWEAEQYIPFDINDVNVDFQILTSDGLDASRMNVLLVASKKDIVNDYIAVFNEAGLKLVVVDVDSFSLQNIFEINYNVGPDEVTALINIGASIMNLNIVRGGASLFTRDVQMGGNHFTQEIQKQFGLSGLEAEQAKVSGVGVDDNKLRETMAKLTDALILEVRRSLDFYNSTAGDGKIAKIYLSGGGARLKSLPDAINQKLGIPVEVINPFQQISFNEKEFDPEYLQEIGPLVTVAAGLATRRPGDK